MVTDLAWLTAAPIAHRGWHGGDRGPENTLGAFEAAAAAGFAIECDVHPTRDGEVAVFHDDALDRLTSESGPVRERTMAELALLTVLGSGERVPSLRETLALVAGRVPVVIELKGFGPRQEGFVANVARDLHDYRGRAALMSFDRSLVARFRDEAPGWPGGLTAEGTGNAVLDNHRIVADAVDFVSYAVNDLPNPFVEAFRASGRPVVTWTVRTPEQVARTRAHADQMTFEGFDPRDAPPAAADVTGP